MAETRKKEPAVAKFNTVPASRNSGMWQAPLPPLYAQAATLS